MDGVEIELGRSCVRRDGRIVTLAPREFGVIAALAILREGASRKRLIEIFWPGNERDGLTSLKVTVHRLRKALGETVLVTSGNIYRLNEAVAVDLWQVEDFISMSASGSPPDDVHAAFEAWQHLCGRASYRANSRTLARDVTRVCQQAGQHIARQALTKGDTVGALKASAVMLETDPLDETAREVAIRAHLKNGDMTAALRELREYETAAARHGKAQQTAALFALLAQRIIDGKC